MRNHASLARIYRRERAARAAPAPARAAPQQGDKTAAQSPVDVRAVLYAGTDPRPPPLVEPEPATARPQGHPSQPRDEEGRPARARHLLLYFIQLYDPERYEGCLVVTAPKSGAEIIPFLKTYVNLPGAIAFTVLYGSSIK